MIAIDTETYDPNLETMGPGGARGDGYIAGVSVGTDDGYKWYFPVRHEGGGNLNPEIVMRFLREELSRPNQPKVGANILYDLEWLATEDVHVEGPYIDVQYAQALLDENAFSYGLDTLMEDYLGEGKLDTELNEWCAAAFGGPATRRGQAKNYWRAPTALVGPYAEGDVDGPMRIWQQQRKALEIQNLLDLFELECSNIQMLLYMRMNGVRVDVPKTERLIVTLEDRLKEDQRVLDSLAGTGVNVWAPDSIVRAFDAQNIKYPRTPKGKPSFRKDWLANHESDVARLINKIRKWDKFNNTFLQGYILDAQVNGRVYGQFHPLKTDDSGTVSGRYSSSTPNLQNIPKRDKELGPMVRGLYIPEEDEDWYKFDYAQIEPRLLLHYARGPVAQEIIAEYQRNPSISCYKMMMKSMPSTIDYDKMKAIYLGMTYAMGAPTLARNMNLSIEEAEPYFEMFHEGAPYIMDLRDRVKKKITRTGEVVTLLGRHARFEMWEWGQYVSPKEKKKIEKEKGEDWFTFVPSYEEAVEKWGHNVKRAMTHKGVNRLIQGGAADILKKAMSLIYKKGLHIGVRLTVHDELDFSLPKTKEALEQAREIQHTMETCVKIKVPLKVDPERGPNWGKVAEF